MKTYEDYKNSGKFSKQQLGQIQRGLEKGLDVSLYTDPLLNESQMLQILYLLPPKECCITTVEKGKVANTIPKPNDLKPIDFKKNVTETSQVKENISNTVSIIKEQNKPHKVLQSIDAIGFGETSQKSKQNIPTEDNTGTSSVGDIAH